MADSTITKQALANALKELTKEEPFDRINVVQICECCNMSRKSFYYHFKDKYDLVNWIFDTDFIALTRGNALDRWELLDVVSVYLYENRDFYRRIMKVDGQNSFREHLREFLYPQLHNRLKDILNGDDIHPMYVDFLTDAILCAILRWLKDKECMEPEVFVAMLKKLIFSAAENIYQEINGK